MGAGLGAGTGVIESIWVGDCLGIWGGARVELGVKALGEPEAERWMGRDVGDFPGCGEGYRGVAEAGLRLGLAPREGAEPGDPGSRAEAGVGIWEDVGV